MMPKKAFFTDKLLEWNIKHNFRPMPWKGEKDPYKIWLSEVILQQTRVEQGWKYYEKFIQAFPSVHDLAKAPQEVVFKLWEGLGYYNRCRNLLDSARRISVEYKGIFPKDYAGIQNLKGIGPYTASAIASFAFNLPHAVVDGNVERVLARYFASSIPVDTGTGKKFYAALADELLDKKKPAIYNQAIMDFGAVICKPKNPLCDECLLNTQCQAYRKNKVNLFPARKKAIARKERWLYYFVIEVNGSIYIRERVEKDVWQGLFEFVLLESGTQLSEQQALNSAFAKKLFGRNKPVLRMVSRVYRQQLTHQVINGRFIMLSAGKQLPFLKNYLLVKTEKISDYPLAKLITTFLGETTAGLTF